MDPHRAALTTAGTTNAERYVKERALQRNQIDLLDLADFDVRLGLLQQDVGIQIFEVVDLVTRWMNVVFDQCLIDIGLAGDMFAQFDTIILLQRARRKLQDNEGTNIMRVGTVGFLLFLL